jgi:CRP-like cAMP-binding protein
MIRRLAVPSSTDSQQNQLLTALPERDWARILPHLERVSLSLGETLYDSGVPLHHVYFPMDAVISLFYVLEDGASAEFAVVGRDGMVGVSLFMGGESTPSRAVVQNAGHAYRLSGRILKEELTRVGGRRSGALHGLLLRYAQVLVTQMAQAAVCNRHHSLDQRICRWLLHFLDRLSSNELVMTQELIATMLGVRREGVTEVAGKLQRAGLIEYSRGHITVLDRAGLEARTCECYAVVRQECDRLLHGSPAKEIASRRPSAVVRRIA